MTKVPSRSEFRVFLTFLPGKSFLSSTLDTIDKSLSSPVFSHVYTQMKKYILA